MPCAEEHGHGHGHGHDHSHDDSHVLENAGAGSLLYAQVDRDNVTALNGRPGGKASDIIKPGHEAKSESKYLESDADDQLMIRVPFTGNVKLRSILLKSGPGNQTPRSIKVFANRDELAFEEVEEAEATQKFDVPITRDVVEFSVRPAKFPSVRNITLFIPSSHGSDSTRIYFLGFRGEYTELSKDPVISVYESAANPADHPKIPGLDGATSRLG